MTHLITYHYHSDLNLSFATLNAINMPSLGVLQEWQCCLCNRKIAKKHFKNAARIMGSENFGDIHSALHLLDSALDLWPQWEKALELKARALLYLKRFKEVVNMLHEYIPSLNVEAHPPESPVQNKEKAKLLSNLGAQHKPKRNPSFKYLPISMMKEKLAKKSERGNQWRYVVLGQACCHLGMMDDAMFLLQTVKRATSAAFRKQSKCMSEDSFCWEKMHGLLETDLVSHLLGSIKTLLRRRAAALASLEAGLYTESIRHFSKIIDGKKAPYGFIAECYMYRAMAYEGAGRMVDAVADCNRTLALKPNCIEALSTRASLFEMMGCFPQCLHDLEQLRRRHEGLIRMAKPWNGLDNVEYVMKKIMCTRQRMRSQNVVDYYMVLGLARGCSRADVERAHLLISLKHSPEGAAHFVDRLQIGDQRDIDSIKEVAKSSAFNLFRLIKQAYNAVLSAIEMEEKGILERQIIGLKKEENERFF